MWGSTILIPRPAARAAYWRRSAYLLLAAVLTACGPNEVLVKGQFPAPLMQKLPLNIALWYDEAFSQHEFFDQAKGRSGSSWIVKTGEAQVDLWNTLLPGMFQQVRHLTEAPQKGSTIVGVDAILVPHIEELQYAIPAHTQIKVYEIWLRYRFELLSPSGAPLAEWSMTAYGKTPTAFLQSDEEAVNLAAVVALRDAGANFASQFRQVAPLQSWLANHLQQGTEPQQLSSQNIHRESALQTQRGVAQ